MVSTSYKHTIEPLIERAGDDVIVLNDESDDEFVPEMTEKLKKRSTPTTKITAASEGRRKTLQTGTGPSITTNYTSISSPTEDAAAAAYRRRYTTNTPVKPSKETDDELLKRVETPYLSDFIRRLGELKADPLPGGENRPTSYDYNSPAASYRSRPSARRETLAAAYAAKALQTKQQPDSAWTVFEKKVRLPLLILLAIFVVVTVYVFLFSSY